MKKIIILIVVFLFVGMGFQPAFAEDMTINISSESEDIEIGSLSEKGDSKVYRHVFVTLNGFVLNHDGGVEITKTGRFTKDITFKNIYECYSMMIYSLIPFRLFWYITKGTIESGRIEGFFGIYTEQRWTSPYQWAYAFYGWAELVEFY